ncbi:MAG: TetR/AcrR family transcriptional regulator [Solirubrobacteraceae bacterium]|nr:TetR/AcrR family transcriptional regulator [Solirubrobacteraceae bacterium]
MSAGTRRAILDAAEAAFVLEPYAKVSVASVADAAHVSVGAVYHHVGDKEGLRVAVAAQIVERAIEECVRPALLAAGTPTDRLIRAAVAYVEFFSERPALFTLAQVTPVEVGESVHARRLARSLRTRVSGLVRELGGIVEEGQRHGEIRRGCPAALVLELSAFLVGLSTLSEWPSSAARRAAGPAGVGSFVEAHLRTALAPAMEPERAPA